MSYGLSQETKKMALGEHNFHGEFCSDCGVSRTRVLFYWRRGMADMVRCSASTLNKEEK